MRKADGGRFGGLKVEKVLTQRCEAAKSVAPNHPCQITTPIGEILAHFPPSLMMRSEMKPLVGILAWIALFLGLETYAKHQKLESAPPS